MYDLIIIGAGPSGLSAAYELSNTDKKILILEKKPRVGGLAETKVFGDYRYDIGPHRFFTKNKEVYELFLKVLDDDAVEVDRKTRILFKNSYFDYPLTPLNALFGLGILESISIGLSYISARIKNYMGITKINNFEDWVVDRFGRKLFNNFFKNYTEKVWGIDCSEIGSDWAAQRIKGLSLSTAIKFALFPNSKKRPKTLVDKFYYPKLGAGMLWEKFEENIIKKNVEILKERTVTEVLTTDEGFTISFIDNNGVGTSEHTKNIFFSNPLLEFIDIFDGDIPQKVIDSAKSLNYRNHISVHITVDKKLFDDNWIYIHSPNVSMARIADFTNFSEAMSVKGNYPLTLEYFCFEDDKIWNKSNDEIINYGLKELRDIFDIEFNVVHSAVSRSPKAYPVIKTGYQVHIDIIKEWLSTLHNITAIGRSGMFKYNNQDHAMATGLYAARNLLGLGNFDPWEVNVDGEYHEEVSNN
jgi:protoporphyrinogen oxidase|tara:strand:+ start:5191 stop:6600 length:1410 start_codon:yes stop_codon:yes gene_type:complete